MTRPGGSGKSRLATEVVGDVAPRFSDGAGCARSGDLAAAARAFGAWVFDDEEVAVVERAGYFEAAGRYVPNVLNASGS